MDKMTRQPRFDWEAEEQRMDELEDLVFQLLERVEKLEQRNGILFKEIDARLKDLERVRDFGHEISANRIECDSAGQNIANAIKAMK